jgi:RimJ/RimL family protein N-acetyltransferase
VQLFTLPGNDASEAVARRAGFHLDGTEPGTHHGEDVTLRRWVLDR